MYTAPRKLPTNTASSPLLTPIINIITAAIPLRLFFSFKIFFLFLCFYIYIYIYFCPPLLIPEITNVTFRCRRRGARRAEWATKIDSPRIVQQCHPKRLIGGRSALRAAFLHYYYYWFFFNYCFLFTLFSPQPAKMYNTPKWGSRRNCGG